MARMCLGSDLPQGTTGKVYLMRNVQGECRRSGYEVWDVTDVKKPVLDVSAARHSLHAQALVGMQDRHRLSCRAARTSPAPLWRQAQSMVIVDWSNPLASLQSTSARSVWSVHNRARPGRCATSLHGAISAYEHPNAANSLARGATADDVIGNRVYAAWGVGDDGVLQILDRKKLLPPLMERHVAVTTRERPRPADGSRLGSRRIAGILYMSPGPRRPHLHAGVRVEAAELRRPTPSSRRATSCFWRPKRRPICAMKRRTGASSSM